MVETFLFLRAFLCVTCLVTAWKFADTGTLAVREWLQGNRPPMPYQMALAVCGSSLGMLIFVVEGIIRTFTNPEQAAHTSPHYASLVGLIILTASFFLMVKARFGMTGQHALFYFLALSTLAGAVTMLWVWLSG